MVDFEIIVARKVRRCDLNLSQDHRPKSISVKFECRPNSGIFGGEASHCSKSFAREHLVAKPRREVSDQNVSAGELTADQHIMLKVPEVKVPRIDHRRTVMGSA